MSDVLTRQQDLPGAGRQHAGQEVDERRLARAVGSDQSLARPALESESDVVGRHQTTKALGEPAGFQRRGHSLTRASTPRTPPIRRSRPTKARAIRNRPIQNIQNCGALAESVSCRILNTIAPAMPP